MDQDIEEMVKECRGSQLAAKAPSIKIQPWPKKGVPSMRLHIRQRWTSKFSLLPYNRGQFLQVAGNTQSLTSDIHKYYQCIKRAFQSFGVQKNLVSDNGTQFTGSEFKNFCSSLSIDNDVCLPS